MPPPEFQHDAELFGDGFYTDTTVSTTIHCGPVTDVQVELDITRHTDPAVTVTLQLEAQDPSGDWESSGSFVRHGGIAQSQGGASVANAIVLFALGDPRPRAIRGRLTVTGGGVETSAVLRWRLVARPPHDDHHSIAFVQSVAAQGNTVFSVTTSPITTTTGNMLVVDAGIWQAGMFTSVTDNNSLPWVLAAGPVVTTVGEDDVELRQYVNTNITGRSGHTFTLTMTEERCPTIAVSEHSGQTQGSTVDQTATTGESGSTTSHTTGLSGTTTQAAEIVRAAAIATVLDTTFTGDGTYTTDINLPGAGGPLAVGMITAYKIIAATGQQIFNYTTGSSAYCASLLGTYKESAAAGPTGTPGAEDRGVMIVRPHTRWGWRG